MRRHQDRPPLAGQSPQERPHPADAFGIEAIGGLVEHEHAGVTEQRERNPEPLAHPEGVAADLASRSVRESDQLQYLIDARTRDAGSLCIHREMGCSRAARMKPGRLENRTDRVQGMGEFVVAATADGR